MKQSIFFKILFLFILSTNHFIAQNNGIDLKAIWENSKNADSIRFKALADFYILNNQSNPDSTLKVLEYYYLLAKEKNNILELCNVANDRGGIYRLKGELKKSMQYYKEAEKLVLKLKNPVLEASIIGNIGNVHANKNEYKEAIQYFTKAFDIFKKINDKKGESHVLTSIGNVYLYIQDYELALLNYQKALNTIKNIDVPSRRIAVIYINIGWTKFEQKKYEEAKQYYEKALKILEVTNDKFFLVSCYITLAQIYLEFNQFQLATDYAEKSFKLSKELNLIGFMNETEIVFAQIDFKKQNIEAARKKGESILMKLGARANLETKKNLHGLLYKCYEAQNNPEKSLEMFQKHTMYKDSIQLEKNKFSLIREVIKSEFDDLLLETKLKNEREKAQLEYNQLKKTYGVIISSIILIALIVFYFYRNLKKDRKKRNELLEEINRLKSNNNNNIVINSNEYKLNRDKIELFINKKLNETDWNVLNILLIKPDISNKDIAEKAFMSVDGIGSSLRRMYLYFDIKESKYKKLSLITEAIKVSNK